ncbi:maleylpyruvate isomerase family mycothiol-dependent enzyme [Kocuria sp. CPCC 205292]
MGHPLTVPGWDVHDVLAHLVDDASTTRLGFLRRLAAAGFDFDRCNARGIARERRADPRDTLAAFRAVSGRTTSAPAPLPTRLVEAFVHGEDIRRPLALTRRYPAGPVLEALRHQLRTSGRLGGGRDRAAGLRLVPADADPGAVLGAGTGPEVHGSVLALLLAVSGRPVGPGELTGPGAAALTR